MKCKSLFLLTLSALLASCASTQTGGPESTGMKANSAPEALRPYYNSLTQNLPVAPTGAPLADDAVITRFAFGSCLNENRSMAIFDQIAKEKPQAFLLIGDNVYGDIGATWAAEIPTLQRSYRMLSSRQEFDRFRRSIPMMTAWDDHDYGANDAGGSFAFKEQAERIYESYWNSSPEVRARPGVYESRIIGPAGKRVQFIMLDTRYFRSDLARTRYQDPAPSLGWYIPNTDPQATILGAQQWAWLAQELDKPADLRFIISSVQVMTSAHGYESWYNFPAERERLYALLNQKGAQKAIFLSGDRNAAGFYKRTVANANMAQWEITSSSLNYPFGKGNVAEKEPDPLRTGGLWAPTNYGLLDIDWSTKTLTMSLRREDGTVIETMTIKSFE